jgi:outer membrane biosynthesis protein TonB
MKALRLSLNRLELGHFQLRKPLIVIGRAPTCDVVLRAPGIMPVHFLVEWIGNGKFDPSSGLWSIVDVSINAEAGEGLVLSTKPIKVGDFSFVFSDTILESEEVIGGTITDNLVGSHSHTHELLEFVQVRDDSGAIEEVRHIPIPKKAKAQAISAEFKEFKIVRNDLSDAHFVNVLLQELPGAVLFLSGRKINSTDPVPLSQNDFLQVKWQGRNFYLRFVDEVKSPRAAVDFWGDPLLKNLTIGVSVALLLFFGLRNRISPEVPPAEIPPVRVARIELPPAPAPEEIKTPIAEQVKTPPKVEAIVEKKKVESAAAGAAKAVTAPTAKVKAGLNTAAPQANVNQIGILGALHKNMNRGQGIRADQIIKNGIVQESVTSKDDSKIVITTPVTGVLGAGSTGGAPTGTTNPGLVSASTTLAGVKNAAPDSKSLISRSGGSGNAGLGSSANGIGSSNSGTGETSQIGDGASDFSVAGGLDRDTVRKIIQSYRAQVRACYDRSLVSSPNLNGRIVYSWKILSNGTVTDAKVAKSTLDSASLRGCVLEVLQQMQFPQSSRGLSTTVIYPFVFQGVK